MERDREMWMSRSCLEKLEIGWGNRTEIHPSFSHWYCVSINCVKIFLHFLCPIQVHLWAATTFLSSSCLLLLPLLLYPLVPPVQSNSWLFLAPVSLPKPSFGSKVTFLVFHYILGSEFSCSCCWFTVRFSVRAKSDFQLKALPAWYCDRVESEWDQYSMGGCFPNFPSWRANPQFRLGFPSSAPRPRSPLQSFHSASSSLHSSSTSSSASSSVSSSSSSSTMSFSPSPAELLRVVICLERLFESNETANGFYVFRNSGWCLCLLSIPLLASFTSLSLSFSFCLLSPRSWTCLRHFPCTAVMCEHFLCPSRSARKKIMLFSSQHLSLTLKIVMIWFHCSESVQSPDDCNHSKICVQQHFDQSELISSLIPSPNFFLFPMPMFSFVPLLPLLASSSHFSSLCWYLVSLPLSMLPFSRSSMQGRLCRN